MRRISLENPDTHRIHKSLIRVHKSICIKAFSLIRCADVVFPRTKESDRIHPARPFDFWKIVFHHLSKRSLKMHCENCFP